MINGPDFPDLAGLLVEFANESQYPIESNDDGIYTATPMFWARCYDSAITEDVPGVLAVLSESEYHQAKLDEYIARRPYGSWTFNVNKWRWEPPTPYPGNVGDFRWDEDDLKWEPNFETSSEDVEQMELLGIDAPV
jgi:hypothetical protein